MIGRIIALMYGLASYLIFFLSFVYAVAFVGNYLVPKSIDIGSESGLAQSILTNVVLLGVFAIQHSVMARPAFKAWWTRLVPPPVERATFVLASSLALILLFWQWRPLPSVVWSVGNGGLATLLTALSFAGWGLVLLSTFLINHFELFGLQQVAQNLSGRQPPAPVFKTPLFYKFVRHPIYLGFIVAFWATPVMTVGHLLFAAATTAYVFVGIFLEERELVSVFGDQYLAYRSRVSMILPMPPKA